MADVQTAVFTTTERKVRKVKKTTKRRESQDQNSEVQITEIDNTTESSTKNINSNDENPAIEEYVLAKS